MVGEVGPAAVAERFRDTFISEESGTLEVRDRSRRYELDFECGLLVSASAGGSETPDEVIRLAFACTPEAIDLHSAPPSPGVSPGDVLGTVEALLAGVRVLAGFSQIREALQAIDHKLMLRPNPTVPLESLSLKPFHGFLLSRLDGSLSYGELASTLSPSDEAEAARFVFALLLLGSAAFDPPLGSGPFRTDQLLTDHIRDITREKAEISFIEDTYRGLQTQNPYEMLGVNETAGIEAIREAYERRKQAVGSERFLERVRDRMRSELRIIEARLAEAYLALQSGSSPRPAEDADQPTESLDLESLSLRREVTKTEVAATLDEKEKLAEQYYLSAKKYYSQADYHNCVQYCTLAIRLIEDSARYHFLLGEAQARNPEHRWQKLAEKSFVRATQLDPWNADYMVTLGQFYKRLGLALRARRQFERALELQPGHPTAREELNLVG